MKDFELVEKNNTRGIKCLACGLISWNVNDVVNRYCGKCHKFLREDSMSEEITDDELLELIHRRYNDPARNWEDSDIQTAVLDIGRLLGVVVSLTKQLRNEHAARLAIKKYVRWMAQTTHQAYHTDDPGAWNDNCMKGICSSTRHELKEWR